MKGYKLVIYCYSRAERYFVTGILKTNREEILQFLYEITHRISDVLGKQSLILVAFSSVMCTFSMHCHILLRNIKMHLKPRIFQRWDCYSHERLREDKARFGERVGSYLFI